VYEGCDAAFGGVGLDARPATELVDADVESSHGMLCGGEEGGVVRIPEAGDGVSGGDGVSRPIMFDPSDEGFDVEVEQEGGEGVSLEGSPLDFYGWCGSMWGEEDGCRRGVKVADKGDEVGWEAEESEGAGEEAVV
jgi:hypothetical protein